MIIQLAEVQRWPGPPFEHLEYAPELWELKKLFAKIADSLPEDLVTQIRWFMFIDRFTEGEVVSATGRIRAGNGNLRVRLNEIGRIFLSAMRAESGNGESIRNFIHDNPLAENKRLDAEKFKWYEDNMVSNVELRGVPLTDAKRNPKA